MAINVSDEAQLRAAIFAINDGGADTVIVITASITLSLSLPMITASMTIRGQTGGIAVDGADAHRAFFIQAGTVSIEQLAINNTAALGGEGGDAAENEGAAGGGGLGAGGAVFVNENADVTLSEVSFGGARAVGGQGGDGVGAGPSNPDTGAGGGGGMGGAGGVSIGGLGAGGGGGYVGMGGEGSAGGAGGGGGEFGSGGPGHPGGGGGGGGGRQANGGFGGAGGGGVGGSPNGGTGGYAIATAGGPGGGGGGGGFPGGAAGAGGIGGGGGGGGANGGGGGNGGDFGGGGGGSQGGGGGFGGGGGGGYSGGVGNGGAGGFGGGGGGGVTVGGASQLAGAGGAGSAASGGGGAALGGAVFVRDGGTLTITDPTVAGTYSVTGGAGGAVTGGAQAGGAGQALGTFAYLHGSSATHLNVTAGSLTIGGAGAIAGDGALFKDGAGTLIVSGANTYTGATTISGGTLSVNGSITSAVTVANGGTLGGTGTVGAVTVQSGGVLATGSSPGVLATGNVNLQAGASLEVEIAAATAGQFDQLDVTGTVTLAGDLDLTLLGGFVPTGGQTYVIIDNDGADAVTGTFAGLAQGATVTVGASPFTISYAGGDGNDVVLTAAAPPAPPVQPEPPAPWSPALSPAQVQAAFTAALGFDPTSPKAASAQIALPGGQVVDNPNYACAQALAQLATLFSVGLIDREDLAARAAELAGPTSGVALQAYQFFTGGVPGQQGLAWLIDSPSNTSDLTDPYYAMFNPANRFINFAVNLGVMGEGRAAFEAAYGALDFNASVRKAYDTIIGLEEAEAAGIEVDAAIAWIVSQQGYFDVLGGSALGGKAAMVGYLMYAGFEAQVGVYYEATHDWLTDAFDGQPAYGVDLIGQSAASAPAFEDAGF